jgi:hypothetical protein
MYQEIFKKKNKKNVLKSPFIFKSQRNTHKIKGHKTCLKKCYKISIYTEAHTHTPVSYAC